MKLFSHGKSITILQYFTDKFEDYWHILYPILSNEQISEDKYLYFLDISKKAISYRGKFSQEGLYLFLGYDNNYHLHALELSIYTLSSFIAWRKTADESWLQKALLHTQWLMQNQESNGAWRICHINPIYTDLKSPWASALAQGFAISALIRAFYYTHNEDYLNVAKKACDFLEIDIDGGGVKREFDNVFIYEEYPRKRLSGVLNGYISAIFAIYELSLIDENYKKLYSKNLENLKKLLPKYDLGYWSLYSLDGNISSGFYHRLIVKQLKVLSELNSDFSKYYQIHLSYQNDKWYALKALFFKIKSRL